MLDCCRGPFRWTSTNQEVNDLVNFPLFKNGDVIAGRQHIHSRQNVYHWDVMDRNTRYILASYSSKNCDGNAVRAVCAGRWTQSQGDGDHHVGQMASLPEAYPRPDVGGRAYPVGRVGRRSQQQPFGAVGGNVPRPYQDTVRAGKIGSRQRYLNCGTITYNLFRGHHSLGNDLPAQPAKVNPPFREWVDVAKVTPSLQSL